MNREFAKGLAKVKENDFLAAIEHFTLAIKDDANNVECYAERAVAYLNTNQFDLSMFDMNRCIEMEPNNSYRYSCRAFLKTRIGDTDGAITDYEMAVKLDPDDAIAYNNLGLVQESKGYRKQAEKSFERSNKLIGYNPNRFDSSSTDHVQPLASADSSGKNSVFAETTGNTSVENPDSGKTVTKGKIVKGVFTSRSGFREFLRFIRNRFKIKE